MSKVNPQASAEAQSQIKDTKDKIDQLKADRETHKKKLAALNDLIKKKDLARDDPSTFVDLIKEIKELGQ